MFKAFPIKCQISGKMIGFISALIVNTFIWYFYAFNTLKEILSVPQFTSNEIFVGWSINFGGAAFSAILGAVLAEKLENKCPLLTLWITLGIISSILPIFVDATSSIFVLTLSLLLGLSLGLGFPSCMAYFSEKTHVENRARIGGIVVFIFGLGVFLFAAIPARNIVERSLILSAWRTSGLVILLLAKDFKRKHRKSQSVSYSQILTQKSFLLYFIPWCMFCIINYSIIPIVTNFFGEDFVRSSGVIEGVLIGIFAIAGGFLADVFGRKRLSILGFVMLGVGYAILGIFPENSFGWYFYIIVDGVAWGIFYNLFLFTIWGDLTYGKPSERYYAIGGLPFLLSNFLRFVVGPYLIQIVSIHTIFSLTSFFLFLAVLPLIYATETLPESKIRERELRTYIEKAKKVSENYIKK